ncbi:MAG: hypothetical protein K2L97_07955 [Muribaculaceae bacterium]|nr:hypothetical protein [Muribaculaceae bacterium]
MKIFRVDRHAGQWFAEAAEALRDGESTPAGVLPVRLIADSAAVRNDRPVFVPDFAREGWVCQLLMAVHIGRLGKFIAPRFASRYISGLSLVGCLTPDCETHPDALTDSFDGAIVLGEMLPFEPAAKMAVTASCRRLQDHAGGECDETGGILITRVVDIEALRIYDTVALISRYTTLKSGDIIIPAEVGVTLPAEIGMEITGIVDGRCVLTYRLK